MIDTTTIEASPSVLHALLSARSEVILTSQGKPVGTFVPFKPKHDVELVRRAAQTLERLGHETAGFQNSTDMIREMRDHSACRFL